MIGWPIKWGAWLPWFQFFWSWFRHLSTREGWDLGRTPCIVIGFLLTLCGKSHIFPFWLQNILKPSRPVYKISFQLSKIHSLYLKSGSPISHFDLLYQRQITRNEFHVFADRYCRLQVDRHIKQGEPKAKIQPKIDWKFSQPKKKHPKSSFT